MAPGRRTGRTRVSRHLFENYPPKPRYGAAPWRFEDPLDQMSRLGNPHRAVLARPKIIKMIERPGPLARAQAARGFERAGEIGFGGADRLFERKAAREIGGDRRG